MKLSKKLKDSGVFDELVIGDWFHLEMMDESHYWMRIGDAKIDCKIEGKKLRSIEIERNV